MLNEALSYSFTQEKIYYLAMLLPLVIQLAGMMLAVLADVYICHKHRMIFLTIIFLAAVLIAQNYLENRLASGEPMPVFRTAVAVLGYCIRPTILVLFFYIIDPERSYLPAWVLTGVNAAIHTTALFGSRICFWISKENHYQGGPLAKFCTVLSILLLAYLLYLTVRKFGKVKSKEMLLLVFSFLIIPISLMLDSRVGYAEQPVTFLTITLVSSCLLYYIWLHLQFERIHEKDLRAQQRVQIMLTQIKPHFLYNSLGAIEELCDSDPQAAKQATVIFSRYLRGNLNSIAEEGDIPFERELAHTKLYLELEQMRFEDALQVRYDITCTDFMIPTLTLEPLAENAVRHGVRGNADGRGTVTISTLETPERYEVSVTDDGPGFDPAAQLQDGRQHIGLQNVRERLQTMCGGELCIQSSPERGTTVTILLPKERENK